MKDERPSHVFINGIDLSEHVKSVNIEPPTGEEMASIPGLKSVGPITISGFFNVTRVCGFCGTDFAPGDEGTPIATHQATGFSTPICPTCFISLQDSIV